MRTEKIRTAWAPRLAAAAAAALGASWGGVAGAAVAGPYTPDASTLHLWHLDDSGAPAVDAVAAGGVPLQGLLGGATLGNPTLFGTGLNSSPTGAVLLAAPALSASSAGTGADSVSITLQDPTTRAFTFEALVRLDFDPAATRTAAMHLIGGEGEGGTGGTTDRQFQFRLDPVGMTVGTSDNTRVRLEFNNFNAGGTQVIVPLPTGADPNAPVQGGWYHVAVTYDGNAATPGNMDFYWTRLAEGNLTAALAGESTQGAPIAINNNTATGGATNTDFSIGNEARSTGGQSEPFVGLVDEVRISSVARTAAEFIVVPEPASVGLLALAGLALGRRRPGA